MNDNLNSDELPKKLLAATCLMTAANFAVLVMCLMGTLHVGYVFQTVQFFLGMGMICLAMLPFKKGFQYLALAYLALHIYTFFIY